MARPRASGDEGRNRPGVQDVSEVATMLIEAQRRLVEFLTRTLREVRELQAVGRFQDPASRAEIAFLEQQLRVAEARVARRHGGCGHGSTGVREAPSVRRHGPERDWLPPQDP